MQKKSGLYVKRLRMAVKNKKNKVKYNQQDLADDLGFTRAYIAQLETDKRDVSLSVFLRWLTHLEVDSKNIFKK